MQAENPKLARSEWYWFAAVILLGFMIRLFRLSVQSLWLDEMTSIQVAQRSLPEILSGWAFNNHTPPLYYVLLNLWSKIIPLTEAGLRLPSVLIDLLNMVLLLRLCLRFTPRINAFFILSAYAVSPFMIYYSQEGRMYTLAVFFALAYSLSLEKLCRATTGLIAGSLLSGILLALGLYTHYYFLFFACAVVPLALYATRSSPKHMAAVCCSGLIAAILFLPWIPIVIQLAESGGQPFRRFHLSVIPYTFFRFVVGYAVFPINIDTKLRFMEEVTAHAPELILVFSLLGLLGYYVLMHSRGPARPLFLSLAWVVSVPILIALVVSFKTPVLSERYFIILFPFFLLLLIGGLELKRARQMQAVCALVAFLILGDLAYFINPNFGKAQWRSAAEYVSTIADGDVIFVEPDYAADVFKYYFNRPDDVFRLSPLKSQEDVQLDEHFEKAVRNHREIILVTSGPFFDKGYSRVLRRIAIEKAPKVFPLETGITCVKWEINRDQLSKSAVGAFARSPL